MSDDLLKTLQDQRTKALTMHKKLTEAVINNVTSSKESNQAFIQLLGEVTIKLLHIELKIEKLIN